VWDRLPAKADGYWKVPEVTVQRPGRGWIGAAWPTGLALLAVFGMSGCSTAASGGTASAGASVGPVPTAYATPAGAVCGTTRTIVNTPVVIKVTKGSVSCATAMSVQSRYTQALRHGALKGNGGGAPVSVSGWTCQGYPTPRVLRDGVTSECHTASADVAAVLDLTASTPAA
jgi:hypothetical protein